MLRSALPVCLLIACAAGAALAAPGSTAPTKRALTPDERVALACLGRIGSKAVTPREQAAAGKARRLFAILPAEAKLRPLVEALRMKGAGLRLFAARSLGALGDRAAARALLARVVREEDAAVRTALVAALRALGEPGSVHVLGKALGSRHAAYRRRAAEALVGLGDELAYPYLIRLWEGRAGDFPRSYFAQVTQHAYLADFDVEVA